MASTQVVKMSVNTNNSPSQDYTTNPDDHSNHNIHSYCHFLLSWKVLATLYSLKTTLQTWTITQTTTYTVAGISFSVEKY